MEENNHEELNSSTGATPPKQPVSIGKEIFEWVSSILIALVIALLLRNFVVTIARVDGDSMNQTLQNNQRLVIVRLGYTPKAGDVIIFNPENGSRNPYVKRIIATEGQEVKFVRETNGIQVYIDGKALDEPYAYVSDERMYYIGHETYTVPEGCVFVMGDNRCNSHDSRSDDVGFVKRSQIMGKAAIRIWPLNKMGTF